MWNKSNYGNDLRLTKTQAQYGFHQGPCDQDIKALRQVPAIRRQLQKLDPERLRRELSEYGAWSDVELEDHEVNLERWLWISCGDIVDK